LHSPKIKAFVESINNTAAELMVDDRKETRRFVFRELIALSKQAKQEHHKIKALELLGKSCGVFKPQVWGAAPAPSEQTLKDALSDRLRLTREVGQ
jgi:hypothetical protein